MGLIEWTPDITAFGISTQVQYYFPGLVEFLDACPVPDVSAHDADFNVTRFLFHLEHLQVFLFLVIAFLSFTFRPLIFLPLFIILELILLMDF